MAQPFTPDQLSEIRAALIESARHHALHTGIKKTSLDMLTADAGIAKSTFYKFYDSKEILFLEIAGLWEADILSAAAQALTGSEGLSGRQRAAAGPHGAVKIKLLLFMRATDHLLCLFQ